LQKKRIPFSLFGDGIFLFFPENEKILKNFKKKVDNLILG